MSPIGDSPVIPIQRLDFTTYYSAGKQSFSQAVERYSITGGTPELDQYFHSNCTEYESVLQNFLCPDGVLSFDTTDLLPPWIPEQESVCILLHSISMGHHRPERLSRSTKLSVNQVTHLLRPLLDCGFLRAERSIVADELQQTSRFLYLFSHPFYQFWFRFVYPHLNALRTHDSKPARESIRRHYKNHISLSYREICKDIFLSLCKTDQLPFTPEQTSSYWTNDLNSNGSIRLAAVDRNRPMLFLADYRYESTPMDSMVLISLEEDAAFAGDLHRAFPGYDIQYGLFSKSGFSQRILNIAKGREDIVLIHEDQILT